MNENSGNMKSKPLCSICLESLLDPSGYSSVKIKIDDRIENFKTIKDKNSSQERKRKIVGEIPSKSTSKAGAIPVSRAFVSKSTTTTMKTMKQMETCATPCGHVFHFHCLQKWLHNSGQSSLFVQKPLGSKASKASQFRFRCPSCNSEFLEKETIQIFLNAGGDDRDDFGTLVEWNQNQNGKPKPPLTLNADQMDMDLSPQFLDLLCDYNCLNVKYLELKQKIMELFQDSFSNSPSRSPSSRPILRDLGFDVGAHVVNGEGSRQLKRPWTGDEGTGNENPGNNDEEQKEPPRKRTP